jgi:antitoxin (DNA-binding transcriptional repressor) of toxin-antitoxin stability system
MAEVVANQVSVRDLKTHLSAWLARARTGEVVEVTSHRKPIASHRHPAARFHPGQPAAGCHRCRHRQLERPEAGLASTRETTWRGKTRQ